MTATVASRPAEVLEALVNLLDVSTGPGVIVTDGDLALAEGQRRVLYVGRTEAIDEATPALDGRTVEQRMITRCQLVWGDENVAGRYGPARADSAAVIDRLADDLADDPTLVGLLLEAFVRVTAFAPRAADTTSGSRGAVLDWRFDVEWSAVVDL